MQFHDFFLCAWQLDAEHVQVIVQASPAGRMRAPVTVPCDFETFDAHCNLFQEGGWMAEPETPAQLAAIGDALASVILPPPVEKLLRASLKTVPQDDTLRLRLCLDERIMDWPWEYLRLDTPYVKSHYLGLHPGISLVREAPAWAHSFEQTSLVERAVFAGTFWNEFVDYWSVQNEYIQLQQGLISVQQFLSVEFVATEHVEAALRQPTSVFYYSGHAMADHGKPRLVELGHEDETRIKWLPVDKLAEMLRTAQTRVAYLAACNSGDWALARVVLGAGVPVVIGAQGTISNWASWNFGSYLIAALAVGLSLDEAIMGARNMLAGRQNDKDEPDPEWGNFMVYMACNDAVPFPRPATDDVHAAQVTNRVVKVLERSFGEDDVKALCFELQSSHVAFARLEYADLRGATRIEKMRELTLFAQRRNAINALIAEVKSMRPDETI